MNCETPENQFHILLFGNNPGELSIYNSNLLNNSKTRFVPDVSFDLKESIIKASQNNPRYIQAAILKSTNRIQLLNNGLQDYFLKESYSAGGLSHAIKNSRKIRRAQIFLYKTYKKSKSHYNGFLNRPGKPLNIIPRYTV